MERYKLIKKEQSELYEKHEQKNIDINEFVKQMKILNDELNEVEKKCINEYNINSQSIVLLNTQINLLQSNNSKLLNEIIYLKKSEENTITYYNNLIKKGVYIYKL